MRRAAIVGVAVLAAIGGTLLALRRVPRGASSVPLAREGGPEEGKAALALSAPSAFDAAIRRQPMEVAAEEVAADSERAPVTASELVLRLLDPTGHPLADGMVRVVRWTASGQRSRDTLSTDEEGRGVLTCAPGTRALELRVPRHAAGELAGRIELARPPAPGVTDLGDFVLSACALLVEGRVVDEAGHPVGAGSVKIQARSETDWFTRDFVALDSQGHFASYEDPPEGELRLVASSRAYLPPDPLPFRCGESGLVVVLVRGAVVAGSIRLPEGTEREDFSVSLRPQGSAEEEPRRTSNGLRTRGRFEFKGLSAGRYDLEVGYLPVRAPLLEIQDIEARDGGPSDPRLQDIDLSAHFRPVRVRVRRPDGEPASGVVYQLLPKPDGWGRRPEELDDGQAVFAALREPLELAVVADGFCVVRLSGVVSDQELTLRQPLLPVRLELAPSVALPPAGASIVYELRFSPGPSGADSWWEGVQKAGTFGPSREAKLALRMPGTYTVRFSLQNAGNERFGIQTVSTIVVRELDREQVFQVEPDDVAYARALAALR